jgi:hypothetical protein
VDDVDNVSLYVLNLHNISKVDWLDVVVSLLQSKALDDVLHQSDPLDWGHFLEKN